MGAVAGFAGLFLEQAVELRLADLAELLRGPGRELGGLGPADKGKHRARGDAGLWRTELVMRRLGPTRVEGDARVGDRGDAPGAGEDDVALEDGGGFAGLDLGGERRGLERRSRRCAKGGIVEAALRDADHLQAHRLEDGPPVRDRGRGLFQARGDSIADREGNGGRGWITCASNAEKPHSISGLPAL